MTASSSMSISSTCSPASLSSEESSRESSSGILFPEASLSSGSSPSDPSDSSEEESMSFSSISDVRRAYTESLSKLPANFYPIYTNRVRLYSSILDPSTGHKINILLTFLENTMDQTFSLVTLKINPKSLQKWYPGRNPTKNVFAATDVEVKDLKKCVRRCTRGLTHSQPDSNDEDEMIRWACVDTFVFVLFSMNSCAAELCMRENKNQQTQTF